MNIRVIIASLILVLMVSCVINKDESDDIEKIRFVHKTTVLADSLDFRFVKLETNDDCLIGLITNIKVFDDRIFVFHNYFPYVYEITENGCKKTKELSFEGFSFRQLEKNNNPNERPDINELSKKEGIILTYWVRL